jgi:hypothetical protein
MLPAIFYLLCIAMVMPVCISKAYDIDPKLWSSERSAALDLERLRFFNYILAHYDEYYREHKYKEYKGHHKKFTKIKKHCRLKKIYIAQQTKYNKNIYWWAACEQKYLSDPCCYEEIRDVYDWLKMVDPDIVKDYTAQEYFDSADSDSQ